MTRETPKITLFRHAANSQVFPAETTLFREGDPGDCMYAIKRGSVKVVVNGRVVDKIRADEVFGEMALLDQHHRSATVVTAEETELVEIDEAEFFILVRHHPHFALQMMRVLSERMRHMHALNRMVEDEE